MPTYEVNIPGKGTFDVQSRRPLSEEEAIQAAMAQFAPPVSRVPEAAPEGGFVPAIKSGVSGVKEAGLALLGRTGLMDEAAAQQAIEEEQAYQQRTFKPTEEGFLEAPFTKTVELFGQSLPYMAAPLTAAAGIAALPLTGTAATIAGLGAAGIASAGQFTGTNLLRQMETGKSLGETNLGNAAVASIPQAALDTVSLRMMPFIRNIFGAAGKEITEEAAKKIASKNIKDVAADYALATGRTMGVEGLTESAQQVLERMQAGLELGDQEARDEYFDSFVGGAVLGGVLAPPGRYLERRGIIAKEEEKNLIKQAAEEAKTAEETRLAQEAEEAEKATPEYRLKINKQLVEKKDRLRELEQLLKDKTTDEDVKDEAKTEAKQLRKELGDLTKQMKESMTKAGIAPTVESALKRQKTQIEQQQTIVDDFGNVISADTALDVPLFDKQGRPVTRRTKDGKDVLKTVKGTLPEDLTPEEEVEGYERQATKTFKYFAEREEALDNLRAAEEREDTARRIVEQELTQNQPFIRSGGTIPFIPYPSRAESFDPTQARKPSSVSQDVYDAATLDEKAEMLKQDRIDKYIALLEDPKAAKDIEDAQLDTERQKLNLLLMDEATKDQTAEEIARRKARDEAIVDIAELQVTKAREQLGLGALFLGPVRQRRVEKGVNEGKVDRYVASALEIRGLEGRTRDVAQAMPNIQKAIDTLESERRSLTGKDIINPDGGLTNDGIRLVQIDTKLEEIQRLLTAGAPEQLTATEQAIAGRTAVAGDAQAEPQYDPSLQKSPAAALAAKAEKVDRDSLSGFLDLLSFLDDSRLIREIKNKKEFGKMPVTPFENKRDIKKARKQVVDNIVESVAIKRAAQKLKPLTPAEAKKLAAAVDGRLNELITRSQALPSGYFLKDEIIQPAQMRGTEIVKSAEVRRIDPRDLEERQFAAPEQAVKVIAEEIMQIRDTGQTYTLNPKTKKLELVEVIPSGKRAIRAERPVLRQQFKTQPTESQIAQGERVVNAIEQVLAGEVDADMAAVLNQAADIIANRQANPTFLNTVDEQLYRIQTGIDKATKDAALFKEIKQDMDNKVAISAAAMQDITTQAQGDMFAEDLATVRATPGMFRRLQKSRKVVKKRERIADLKQLEKDLRVAKRNADADAAGALKLEEKNIFQEIIKLAEDIKRDMGDDISVTNAQKFAALDDRIKKLVAEYKKKKPKEATSEVAENERILTKLLKEAATPEPFSLTSTSSAIDFASNTQSIRARINALEIKIKEASSALMEVVNNPEIYEAKFKRKYGKGAKTRVDKLVDARTRFLEDAKKQLENFELIIKKTIIQPRSAAEKVELPTTAADLRAAKQALATRINAILLRLKEQDIKLTEDVRGFIGLGLNLPGIRFERKTLEEISKEIAEARAERKAAIKKAGAKTKKEKDAIPLKLKSRFKVAAIKSAEDIAAERREIESDSFNRTLSPKDVQIKVQEQFDKALENRDKATKELDDFRKLVNKAKGAKDFAKYEKEFFTKLKELSAVVNVAQANYISARDNLNLLQKVDYDPNVVKRQTAPRTIAGPRTEAQKRYTPEQLAMLTGMPANMMPRITTIDDGTIDFRIGDSKPETPVDFAEAEKRLKEVKALAKKMGVEVKIYRSVADVPADITRAIARQDFDPLTDSIKGGVLPNGDVFIIIDAHSSMLDLEQTVAHELVGHYSFESMLGKDGMENLMRKVDKSFATKENQNGLENLADSLGLRDQYNAAVAGAYNFYKTRLEKGELTEKDVLRLAKTDGLREIIAYTMEKRVDQSFMQKAKRWLQELAGAFRALLKRLGLVDAANMSTSDLFYLMKQAHDNFTAGKPMAFTKPDGTVSLRQPVVPVFATPLASMVAAPSSALGSLKANLFGLNFRVQFVDRLAALDALVKKGVEKAIIPALKAMDVMYFSRFAGQRNNFTADYLTSGVGRIERVKGELMYVGGDGPSMRDVANALRQSGIPDKQVETAFTAFLIARRAEVVGVDKLDYSETITDLEVKATLAQFAKNQPFQKAAGLYDQYNNNLIDLMVQAEALDPKKAERLKNSKYVPYYREKNGGIELVIGTEKPVRIGSFVDQPQLRELKGGVNKILPVFTGSVQNTQMIVDIVLRNMAAKSTAFVLNQMGLMDIRTGGGPKLSDGTPKANVVRFTIFEDQGGEKKLVEKYAVMKPEVGETIFGNIPTELVVRGMEGIKTTIPGIVRLMGLPANWLRNFVTKNPRYAVNQVFRDSMAAVITTGADFVPVVQTIKDLATMNRNGSLGTLRGRGVVGGQVITGATDDADKILRQITAGKPGWEMTMAKLDEFAMMGDAATRVSMYNSFLKQGLSEREATFASLEAMNFSRRGLSPTAAYANTVIPFFNAQVQGLDVLYRAAIGDMPASQRLKVQHKMKVRMLMMGVFTIAYAAMMEEDEAYKNANPEERYSNWFVPTPFGTFRVPIPFELGFVAKSIPEGIYRLLATDDKASSVLGALRKQLFASIPGDLPIAAKVPVELMLNKSFFTGRPVIDARLEGLVKSEQFGQKTPELIKLLGFDSPQVIKDVFGLQGVSPAQVEYFIKGYTGTLPLALLRLFDPVLASGEVVKADMKLEDMPIVGSFFQPKDAGGIINASYAGIQQAQRVSNTYKKLIADGRIKEATEYFNENTAAFSIASLGGAFQQQMGELTKAERAIRASDLSSAEKRERLDEFRQIKIDYSKQFRTIKEQIERQASRSGLQ
jgi:hypothetical protein